MENTTPTKQGPGPAGAPMQFSWDLTVDEMRRVSAALAAIPDWDPVDIHAAETEAHSMLYSGLDAEQRAMYDLLREQGVLNA